MTSCPLVVTAECFQRRVRVAGVPARSAGSHSALHFVHGERSKGYFPGRLSTGFSGFSDVRLRPSGADDGVSRRDAPLALRVVPILGNRPVTTPADAPLGPKSSPDFGKSSLNDLRGRAGGHKNRSRFW